VEDATSQGIAQVNMITCFMSAMRPDALVNKGNYIALLDKNKCDPNARSDSGNSGSNNAGSNAPSYMTAIVDSTRSTNNDPMHVKTWLDMSEKDMAATIFLNISASEAPSAGNPYGVFRLDYCGRVNLSSGFPIEFTAGGKTYNGQMGYYGLWLPPEAAALAVNGSTVQRVTYASEGPPTKTPYTLVKADGRMTKYTKKSRTLQAADKIKFNTFVFDVTGFFDGAVGNRQYELYWDDAAGTFKVSGVIECGDRGCQTHDLDAEK